MSLRLNRFWLLPVLLLASQSWALGLGDIRLSSALNEPLVAEIELLAATPEELENLTIQLSSQETFERYDLDRPMFLSRLRFRLIRSGGVDGNIVSITSEEPVTEPFITFLVEAVWTRGRLLREYTLLLDPPTFAPPPAAAAATSGTDSRTCTARRRAGSIASC
jgi:pilus assembly protein FimV